MKQYIDKAVLVAKIEKLLGNPYYMMAIKDVLSILDTLEVKELDLDKEYKNFVEEDPVYNKLVNNIVGKAIAKHFFELGLKVQKGE